MIPSVGKIVHYVHYGAPVDDPAYCRAAIIIAIPQDAPGYALLNVFNPDGNILTSRRVLQDDLVHQGGTWHAPEQVDEPA